MLEYCKKTAWEFSENSTFRGFKNKEKYEVEWKILEVRLWKIGSSWKGA